MIQHTPHWSPLPLSPMASDLPPTAYVTPTLSQVPHSCVAHPPSHSFPTSHLPCGLHGSPVPSHGFSTSHLPTPMTCTTCLPPPVASHPPAHPPWLTIPPLLWLPIFLPPHSSHSLPSPLPWITHRLLQRLKLPQMGLLPSRITHPQFSPCQTTDLPN